MQGAEEIRLPADDEDSFSKILSDAASELRDRVEGAREHPAVKRASEMLAGLEWLASTGEDALALARAEHPDVVVVDVLTDGVDVFEVVEELRADQRAGSVQIVVLTSEGMTAESKQRLHGQIDRVAQKSELDRRMLIELVGSLVKPQERMESR